MSDTVTIEIPGPSIPTAFVRVLTSGDVRPRFYSRITGPWSAFEFKEGANYDRVRVVEPDQVEIDTFEVLV